MLKLTIKIRQYNFTGARNLLRSSYLREIHGKCKVCLSTALFLAVTLVTPTDARFADEPPDSRLDRTALRHSSDLGLRFSRKIGAMSTVGGWSSSISKFSGVGHAAFSLSQRVAGDGTSAVASKLKSLHVTPEEYGAVADCSTDSTAAIQQAINAGRTIEFLSTGACYLTDTIVINNLTPRKIIINAGVTVKRKAGGCGDAQVFHVYNSPGTEFGGGGTIDGNRLAFNSCISSFNAGWTMDGIVIRSADVLVRDLRFVNIVRNGINAAFSDRLRLGNLEFSSSGTGVVLQFIRGLHMWNIHQFAMGNLGFPIYQHINEIRGVSDSTIDGFHLTSWNPDRSGLDPIPGAIGFQVTRTTVSNVTVSGFKGTGGVGTMHSLSEGITIPSCVDSQFFTISSRGNAYANLSVGGAIRCQFSGISLYDGTYQAYNFLLSSNAYENTDISTSAFDTVGIGSSRDITISNLISEGGGVGLQIKAGENISVSNSLFSNNEYGVSVQCSSLNMALPNTVAQCSRNVSFIGVKASANSYCGFFLDGFDHLSIDGGSQIYNNGQKDRYGALFRGGVCVGATAASGAMNIASGAFLGDDQNWIRVKAASYKPGTTDANNQFKISLIDPQAIQPGQYIILKNASGYGGDVTARVITLNENIDFKTEGGVSSFGGNTDQITVQTAEPAKFSATASSVALPGTISSTGTTVTGSGTTFSTSVKGHAWLCSGTNCARVARVNSNTQIITETPFAPRLSGTTATLIAVDIAGIPSQSHGIAVQSGPAVGPFSYGNVDVTGCKVSPFYFANDLLSQPYGNYGPSGWTPTDGSGVGLKLIVRSAQWTRYGRTVMAEFFITWPTTSDTSAAIISGLPFADNSAGTAGGVITYTNVTTPVTLSNRTGTKTFRIHKFGGEGVTNAELSGMTLRGVILYMTTEPPF